MDKRFFFKQLDEALAQKYNTSPDYINRIRHQTLTSKKSPAEIIEHAFNRSKFPRRRTGKTRTNSRSHNKLFYMQFIEFFKSLSTPQFEDIVQKTTFDKS